MSDSAIERKWRDRLAQQLLDVRLTPVPPLGEPKNSTLHIIEEWTPPNGVERTYGNVANRPIAAMAPRQNKPYRRFLDSLSRTTEPAVD